MIFYTFPFGRLLRSSGESFKHILRRTGCMSMDIHGPSITENAISSQKLSPKRGLIGPQNTGNKILLFVLSWYSGNCVISIFWHSGIRNIPTTCLIKSWRSGCRTRAKIGTTNIGYGATNADAGVGIGMKRGDSNIWLKKPLISR